MAFGSTGSAGKADVEFTATTGEAKSGIEELRRTFSSATKSMNDDALRLASAQDRLDRALVKSHGQVTSATRAAELNLRNVVRANEATAGSANEASAAIHREAVEVERLGRGALVGAGLVEHLGRAAAFSSTAFLGGAGLVFAVKEFTKAAQEHQASEAQLAAALKAQGINYAAYRHEIEETLRSQEQLTGFSEEDTTQAFTKLVRTTGDVGDALKRTALAAKIADGTGKSLAQTSDAVNKALGGSATALRRLGVILPAGVSGYKALEIASQRYAGSAQADADTAAGAQKRLSLAITETEVTIGNALVPTVKRLDTELAHWLDKSENQKRIQDDVNKVVRDGTQIVHGLADAEKLIAPPIHAAVQALGGLEHAVELALIAGLAMKAKRGAESLGLIQAASARARTQIVSDAAVEERALAGVATQAERTAGTVGAGGAFTTGISPLTRRVGAYTGVGYQSVTDSTGGIIKRYGAKLGGPLALAAILSPSYLPAGGASSNLQGASTAALAAFALSGGNPLAALVGAGGYELGKGGEALSSYLSKQGIPGINRSTATATEVQALASAAAAGQVSQSTLDKLHGFGAISDQVYAGLSKIVTAATVYTVTRTPGYKRPQSGIPSSVSGSAANPAYLSPAQKRAIANSGPQTLASLRAQLEHDQKAIAFLGAPGHLQSGAAYATTLSGLRNDEDATQSQIDQILQAAASQRASAARKAAAAKKAADEARVRGDLPGGDYGVSGIGAASPATARLSIRNIVKSVGSPSGSFYDQRYDQGFARQVLDNRVTAAQLKEAQAGTNQKALARAQRSELAAQLAIVHWLKEKEKGLKGAALAQAQANTLSEQLSYQQLKNQLAQAKSDTSSATAQNEAQFLSSFAQIQAAYAPNSAPIGGKATTHLYELVHEHRATNKHLAEIKAAGRSPYSARTLRNTEDVFA